MKGKVKRDKVTRSIHTWTVIVMYSAIALLAIVLTLRVITSFPPGRFSGISGWLTFGATLILAAITFWYAKHTRDMARTTHKSAQGDMLLRLNELYADKRTSDAIQFMNEFGREQSSPAPGSSPNRYVLGETYYDKYRRPYDATKDSRHDASEKTPCDGYGTGAGVDQLRWHLTNFWYTVAMLRNQKIIGDQLIKARFGSSLDVIDILEPIEAVLGYHLREAQTTEWPVWNLYARYDKGKPPSETIPAYPKDFDAWVASLS